MQLPKHLKSFHIYNILLFLIFCIIVNYNEKFYILYYSLYSFFHFLIIYLGFYHNRLLLYFIYFSYGLGLDILWLNEIGPHLLVFIITLSIINLTNKYLYNLSSLNVYFAIIFIQIIMVTIDLVISKILFTIDFNNTFLIIMFTISLFLSYPVFLLFSKIDTLK